MSCLIVKWLNKNLSLHFKNSFLGTELWKSNWKIFCLKHLKNTGSEKCWKTVEVIMYCANGEIRIYRKNGVVGFYFVFKSPIFFKLILWFGRKSSQVLLFDCLELLELSVFSPVAYTVLLLKPLFKRSGSNGRCGFVLASAFTELQIKDYSQRESVLVFLLPSQTTSLFLFHLFI